jgi:hypothetical protein
MGSRFSAIKRMRRLDVSGPPGRFGKRVCWILEEWSQENFYQTLQTLGYSKWCCLSWYMWWLWRKLYRRGKCFSWSVTKRFERFAICSVNIGKV